MCMNICHLCHPGWTELHTAVCSGDKECVEQLENRMSVDAADGSRTPLHLAASEVSEPAKTIDLLQPAAAAADIRQCTKAPQQGGVRAPTSAPPAVRFSPLNLACDSKCKEAVADLQSEGLSKAAEGTTEDQIRTEARKGLFVEKL
ncbi:unnamed protein product [Cladocopium goreaui]|uniref:Uncharacterized protein n=1 Tax=Cladocopium goreaui TaxID=2562237 RepID=A0A9P1FRA6_9DINO|nr:unnamed protein product [Cladocopium goreaui]